MPKIIYDSVPPGLRYNNFSKLMYGEGRSPAHDALPGKSSKPGGSKHLQEGFAQVSGMTKKNHGDNYKYDGTYEDIGKLIREKVAAYSSVLEDFFKVIMFNYVFSNGDAHLKNFSLVRSEFGYYMLSRAYDLMCTVLHTPNESDTALDLYKGDMESRFFTENGYYGTKEKIGRGSA